MSSVRLVDGRQIVLFHKDGNGNTIGRQNAEILTENFGDGQCGLQGRGDVTANLGFTIFVGNRAYTIPACEMNLPENVFDALNKGQAKVVPKLEIFQPEVPEKRNSPKPKFHEQPAPRSPVVSTTPKTILGSKPGTSGRQKFYKNLQSNGTFDYDLVNWADIVTLAVKNLGSTKCKLSDIYRWTEENIVVKDRRSETFEKITSLTNWEASIRQNRKHIRKTESHEMPKDQTKLKIPETASMKISASETNDPLSFLSNEAVNAELSEFGADDFDMNEFLENIGKRSSSPIPELVDDISKQIKDFAQNKDSSSRFLKSLEP